MFNIDVFEDKLSFDLSEPTTIPNILRLTNGKWFIDFDVYLPLFNMNLQRPLVWTLEQKQLFIISIIQRKPMTPIAVYIDYDNHVIEVIDGKQRLNTVIDFVNNKFPLIYNNEEIYFKDINDKIRILLFTFQGNIVIEPLTDQQKIEWFLYVNNLGTPQQDTHIQSLKSLKE